MCDVTVKESAPFVAILGRSRSPAVSWVVVDRYTSPAVAVTCTPTSPKGSRLAPLRRMLGRALTSVPVPTITSAYMPTMYQPVRMIRIPPAAVSPMPADANTVWLRDGFAVPGDHALAAD